MKNKPHNAAMYLRLSRDDHAESTDVGGGTGNGLKTESNSISNQREIIREFIRGHQGIHTRA